MNMNTREKPIHTPMDQFPSAGRELLVGGIPLERLVDRVGQTPFYAYDRQLLTRRVAELRAALPASIKLHYAMKANPMPAVVNHMARLVDGIDVASAGELQVALDAGAAGIGENAWIIVDGETPASARWSLPLAIGLVLAAGFFTVAALRLVRPLPPTA